VQANEFIEQEPEYFAVENSEDSKTDNFDVIEKNTYLQVY
jgi:hypothetical protein